MNKIDVHTSLSLHMHEWYLILDDQCVSFLTV